MVKGGTQELLLGVVLGAAGLYIVEHLKGFSFSVSNPQAKGVKDTSSYAGNVLGYVGNLPGQTLPFFDDLDDSYVTSEVWDRRTSKYRNDGVIYNTVPRGGSGLGLDGRAEWDPNKGLQIAGAYGNSLERDTRTRQQHSGGNYPACVSDESTC